MKKPLYSFRPAFTLSLFRLNPSLFDSLVYLPSPLFFSVNHITFFSNFFLWSKCPTPNCPSLSVQLPMFFPSQNRVSPLKYSLSVSHYQKKNKPPSSPFNCRKSLKTSKNSQVLCLYLRNQHPSLPYSSRWSPRKKREKNPLHRSVSLRSVSFPSLRKYRATSCVPLAPFFGTQREDKKINLPPSVSCPSLSQSRPTFFFFFFLSSFFVSL